MAILLPAEIITQVRLDIADSDPTTADRCFSDTDILAKINKYYLKWYEVMERRSGLLSATSSGLTFTAAQFLAVTTPTDVFAIDRVMLAPSAGATAGPALPIYPEYRIQKMSEVSPTPAAPRAVAFSRTSSGAVSTIGAWRVVITPPADATYYLALLCRRWPTLLTAGSTNPPDCTELGAYTIGKLAAAELAGIMGEDETYVRHILRDVPDEVAAEMGVQRPGLRPVPMKERAA